VESANAVAVAPLALTIPLELEVRPNTLLRLTNTLTKFGTARDEVLDCAWSLVECN